MKKVIKIVIEVICYIIVIGFTLFILYTLYIFNRPIDMNYCSTYGTNYKMVKIDNKFYCCGVTSNKDYVKCIGMDE